MQIPNHIAFIMDGNGRWATSRLLPRNAGHSEGVKALKRVINGCMKYGVKVISLYAFSSENWKRPEKEVKELCRLLKTFFTRDLLHLCNKPFRVNYMGDIDALPSDVKEGMIKCMRDTADVEEYVVNIGINYGGRDEICRAVNKMISAGIDHVDEQTLSSYLDTAGLPDPDVIVRTAGEMRVSNFMLYQLAYSEFIFLDKYWPDMKEDDVNTIIEEYNTRHRKFGAL